MKTDYDEAFKLHYRSYGQYRHNKKRYTKAKRCFLRRPYQNYYDVDWVSAFNLCDMFNVARVADWYNIQYTTLWTRYKQWIRLYYRSATYSNVDCRGGWNKVKEQIHASLT